MQESVLESKNPALTRKSVSCSKSESFGTQELIGFITSFCNSHYGKRSAKRRKDSRVKKDQVLPRE